MSTSKKNHRELAASAYEEVRKLEQVASKNVHRLNYHIMAPANWINDPNGLIEYQGEYHVFYQHHPFGVEWGPMHWGHIKSPDLVRWEHVPIALAPSESYDEGGIFSGSAIEHNGSMYLFYTGVVYDGGVNRANKANRKECQCLAVSHDGLTFEKHDANPIIPHPPADGSKDFRDPKVWKHQDRWYMVVGSSKEGIGKILLYESSDLVSWDYKGVLAESDDSLGYMWECPDVFPLGEKWVLVVSPMGLERRKTIYFVGDLDYGTGRFTRETTGEMDYGFDFYAAQTFEDHHQRRIMIGWMDSWDAVVPSKQGGWAGAFTIPRVLSLTNEGKLLTQPIPEIKQLRANHRHFREMTISPESKNCLGDLQGDSLEILVEFDLDLSEANEFGIKLRLSEINMEETVITYDAVKKEIRVNRERSDQTGNPGVSVAPVETCKGNVLKLHLFLDRSSIELFVNDGRTTISNRIYSSPSSLGIGVFARGGIAKLRSVDSWKLNSIWE